METNTAGELAALFAARARAAAATVHTVADAAVRDACVAEIRAEVEARGERVGVVRAARGIAETGTCVVVTDDEETRLATMLPETTVFLLRVRDLVADLPDMAAFLRERQTSGGATYTSFISGPSRTADIERVSAIGVHGPLAVHVILEEG